MDLSFTAEELAFRDDVRTFLDEKLSPEMAARASRGAWPSKDDMQAWNSTLADRGWAAPHWPSPLPEPRLALLRPSKASLAAR